MSAKPKILFYDIETTPVRAYIWRPGKQVIRHGQLHKSCNVTNIICIGYCWNDDRPAKVLYWDYNTQNCEKLIEKFDLLIKKADVTIGKNSDRFDVKHINTQRMLHGLPGLPEWAKYTDDLEKQMRKYFALPSQSLDYISGLLGFGGKNPMEFNDWIEIVEQGKNGKALQRKMGEYCAKDVEDTRAVWNRLEAHITPKFNYSTFYNEFCCTTCGSSRVIKNGTRIAGKSIYQHYYCNEHGGYAGRATISKKGTIGTLGV